MGCTCPKTDMIENDSVEFSACLYSHLFSIDTPLRGSSPVLYVQVKGAGLGVACSEPRKMPFGAIGPPRFPRTERHFFIINIILVRRYRLHGTG